MAKTETTPEPHGFPGDDDYVAVPDTDDVDTFLGAPPPAVTWPTVGTFVRGVVLDRQMGVQRTPQGETRTWADGEERRQVIITLQTDERADDDDDGRRRLFVKGHMVKAMRDECRRVKQSSPRPGDALTVTYTEDGKAAGVGLNPPKLFAVQLTPLGDRVK